MSFVLTKNPKGTAVNPYIAIEMMLLANACRWLSSRLILLCVNFVTMLYYQQCYHSYCKEDSSNH